MKENSEKVSIQMNRHQIDILKGIVNAEFNNIVALSGSHKKILNAPIYKELKKLNDKFIEFA